VDGLTGREGAFLACSFWMADCLGMVGRRDDALKLLERLLGLRNDLGLLSEEYDAIAKRQVGNFPQAFSHVSLVNTSCNLTGHTLEDVVPSPETYKAIRRSISRRSSPRSTRSHSILSPSRRHGTDDVEGNGITREPRRPTKAAGVPAPRKRRSD
jgi:hypothetical protein